MALPTRSLLRRAIHQASSLPPTIKEQLGIPAEDGKIVKTHGFVKSIRKSKNVGFLDLTDGTTSQELKVILRTQNQPKFQVGQSVSITGEWSRSAGKGQDKELRYDPENPRHSYQIIGSVPDDYPLQKKVTSMSFLRSLPSLKHRTATIASFYRLRSFLEGQMLQFFNTRGFTKVSPPIITSSDCEGAGETFKIAKSEDFFGKAAYLTVSTQLHIEALAMALNRVWTLTPCFRAEESNTTRHLSEFWMLEAEVCHANSLEQILSLTEDMIRFVTQKLVDSKDEYLRGVYFDPAVVEGRWLSLLGPRNRWHRMTYIEAIEKINAEHQARLKFGDSLSLEHERLLARDGPVFVTDYPQSVKPFYMSKSANFDETHPTVACFDLLLPEFGELVGGSLREHEYETLTQTMTRQGMSLDEMEWYTDLRRNGTVPHGGFGMGWERFITYLSGHDNVRDVIPFPRAPGLCKA
ncbi:uncharacterized protein LODBEIA_P60970 [Lodderomyces beijingensis]|uniref:asparagine--tRNA ligase n=1 Tax=Lodderomyces beijingensis TaxID=1775926 RepID=A0ABP0ZUQ6_9ASCO